jgi:hypothetical protein
MGEVIKPLFGATNQFPRGKLNEDDEGELQFGIAITEDLKTLVINFGKPIEWIGMARVDVLALAHALKERANEMEDE